MSVLPQSSSKISTQQQKKRSEPIKPEQTNKGIKSVISMIQESMRKEAEASPRTWMTATTPRSTKNSKWSDKQNQKNQQTKSNSGLKDTKQNDNIEKYFQDSNNPAELNSLEGDKSEIKEWNTWMKRSQSDFHVMKSKRREIKQRAAVAAAVGTKVPSTQSKQNEILTENSLKKNPEHPQNIQQSQTQGSYSQATFGAVCAKEESRDHSFEKQQLTKSYMLGSPLSRRQANRTPTALQVTSSSDNDTLRCDYEYVLDFIQNQIEDLRDQLEERDVMDELSVLFPSRLRLEEMKKDCHPEELCGVLRDYSKYMLRLLADQQYLILHHLDVHSQQESQLMIQSAQLDQLQLQKQCTEATFAIEMLNKQNRLLQDKLTFMEHHCTAAITYLSKDNEELIDLIHDKDNVMDKIQAQVELKNEHIRSQDQKLLSVLIYEFKLRKIDIKYQGQLLKLTKKQLADLQHYHQTLEEAYRGFHKIPHDNYEDRLNHLNAYIQAIKNELYHQILALQSQNDSFSQIFTQNKINSYQQNEAKERGYINFKWISCNQFINNIFVVKFCKRMNEVQDKIAENQLFAFEDEMAISKSQSAHSKISFGEQIQAKILTNSYQARKLKRQNDPLNQVQIEQKEGSISAKSQQGLKQQQLSQNSQSATKFFSNQQDVSTRESKQSPSKIEIPQSPQKNRILTQITAEQPIQAQPLQDSQKIVKKQNFMELIGQPPDAKFNQKAIFQYGKTTPTQNKKPFSAAVKSRQHQASVSSSANAPYYMPLSPSQPTNHKLSTMSKSSKSTSCSVMTAAPNSIMLHGPHSSRNQSSVRFSLAAI